MPAHRLITRDGYVECFACGTVVEIATDADTDATFGWVECRPGGHDHPPYLIPYTADDPRPPLLETCAAHPYSACERDVAYSPEV